MGLDANIGLIVATLDLKLVQLIRGAMNTDAGRATALGPAPNPDPRPGHGPDRFEPRTVFHPTPRYEPRPVLHPTPRVETGPVLAPANPIASSSESVASASPTSNITPSGIEPVWKSLPPIETPHSTDRRPPIVKVVYPPPVVSYKGTLLDFFL